ncbi:MAG: NUDIX domain-containing protein [Myxococcaceae bacterium]|nr:NUDIX domain-containing protein [Myxococcaceae bacterium]
MGSFKFCPRCGKELVVQEHAGRPRPTCPGDGFVHWGNPTPVVAAIIEHKGAVLLARGRGWPEKFFALVTGFLEAGETPEAGVLREVKEELSLDVEIVSLVGVYPFELKNELIICWHVRARDEQEVKLSDELEAFKYIAHEKLRPWDMGTGLAVRDWLKARSAAAGRT